MTPGTQKIYFLLNLSDKSRPEPLLLGPVNMGVFDLKIVHASPAEKYECFAQGPFTSFENKSTYQ